MQRCQLEMKRHVTLADQSESSGDLRKKVIKLKNNYKNLNKKYKNKKV